MSYTPPPGSGGGGGAPTDATYVTTAAHGSLSAEALLSAVIGRGTLAARPAAPYVAGRLYYVTDDSTLYRDSGTAWQAVEGAASAGAPTDATYVTTTAHASLSAEVLLSSVIGRGLLSARPTTPYAAGRLYYATDDTTLYRDNGGGWDTVEGASASVSGSVLAAHVARVAVQAIATGTDVAISFDTETRDDGGFWVVGSPTRITIPATGWFNCTAWAIYEANITGIRYLHLRKNNVDFVATASSGPHATDGSVRIPLAMNLYLIAGDYLELLSLHTRGSNLNVNAALSIAKTGIG